MAIDAKVSFLGEVERRSGDVLTKNDLTRMLQIISEVTG